VTDGQESRGDMPYEPGRCECGQLVTLHRPIEIAGVARRGPCSDSNCDCRRFVAAEVDRA
jgi:hypothetical protein